jgi:hypothetical protein
MIEDYDRRVTRCALASVFLLAVGLASGCGRSIAVADGQTSPPSADAADVSTANLSASDESAPVPACALCEPASRRTIAASGQPDHAATTSVKTAAAERASGARLGGRVVYRGDPPARRPINMSKDAKCVEMHGGKTVFDEDLIVGADGGVKNAFIRVQRGAPKMDYPMPEKPAVLSQEGCMFHPRVQGIRVGQKLLVDNADPVTHNVRSFPVLNPAFNFGQPPKTEPRERIFERAEREIEIQCDFHPWMHAYVFVMDHPFYSVSADDGTYAIEGLPPGEYALEIWHEKLGKQRQTVKVTDADVSDLNFTYPR